MLKLSEPRQKIILALADCDMNVSEVSRALYMGRSTVEYHLKRIKQLTGKNPVKFYDLCHLVLWVKEEKRAEIAYNRRVSDGNH